MERILIKETDVKLTSLRVRSILQTALCAGVFAFALSAGFSRQPLSSCQAQDTKPADDKVPLPIKLPKAVFAGTAANTKVGPNVEKLTGKPRPVPLVPKGTVNLALHKKVTSSAAPFSGSLDLITDGDKEARDDSAVELKPKLQ